MLQIGLFKISKRLVLVARSNVRPDNCRRINWLPLVQLQQFLERMLRLRLLAGPAIDVGQHNLFSFVSEVSERKAIPVLVTSINAATLRWSCGFATLGCIQTWRAALSPQAQIESHIQVDKFAILTAAVIRNQS